MITKSGIDTKEFEFKSAGLVSEELFLTYTSDVPTGLFVLSNSNGMEVCITNVGARIVSIMAKDKYGKFRDVAIGCDSLKGYYDYNLRHDNFFGACIGRYANRIGNGFFELDGKGYQLPINNKPNCLHGGPYGWTYQSFTVKEYNSEKAILRLHLSSPDGDMGFPGNVEFDVCYHLTEDDSLEVFYSATTDKSTVINVTNHSYFNLEGNHAHTTLNDEIFICAKQMTELGNNMLPTGRIIDIEPGSPFDFFGKHTLFGPSYYKKGKRLGKDIYIEDDQIKKGNGYDHNFVLLSKEDAEKEGIKAYKDKVPYCAKCHNPVSGITMEVYTSLPGVQLYDSVDCNFSIIGKNSIAIGPNTGVCFETQSYPDSPNQKGFPSVRLDPDKEYKSVTVYKFN